MKVVAAVPAGKPATLPASVPRRKELAGWVRRDRLETPFANSRYFFLPTGHPDVQLIGFYCNVFFIDTYDVIQTK